jgi:hypothetical protein
MFNWKKVALLACATVTQLVAFSQTTARVTDSDDGIMRSEGKIYVVMAVAVTIMAGLLLYLIRLDRKISKLEKGETL